MREILFRGKGIKDNVWVYGDLLQDKCGHTRIQAQSPLRFSNEVDFSTVGQYTGLTDKNGKKIFEGDIVDSIEFLGEVYYDKDGCFDLRDNSELSGGFIGEYNSLEIIGNIYDNPELLEGKDE